MKKNKNKEGSIAIEVVIVGAIVILAGVIIMNSLSKQTKNLVNVGENYINENIVSHQESLPEHIRP